MNNVLTARPTSNPADYTIVSPITTSRKEFEDTKMKLYLDHQFLHRRLIQKLKMKLQSPNDLQKEYFITIHDA